MAKVVIKVENISKQYRLGEVGTGSIAHDLNVFWHNIRGKENPYLKIGDANDRTIKGESDYVWALKDINFEVKQGEVLGIIGRNGAGKSTLLKILSKTTAPTTGNIKIRGRIASLLEVGTGFHPDLSGRDNIYLNGAILGMTKKEIKRKFDEIVDFAGIERFIDTPVKRYSSGMYVRLAFAVAAHLEPEILIVDEVLAVGDVEFQKKCLGKMRDVSANDGRTVLFVSHNMAAIKNLCSHGLYLRQGGVVLFSNIDETLNSYFIEDSNNKKTNIESDFETSDSNVDSYFISWKLLNGISESAMYSRKDCNLKTTFFTKVSIPKAELGLVLRDYKGDIIYACNSRDNGGDFLDIEQGEYSFDFSFRFPAKMGNYEIDIAIVSDNKVICHMQSNRKLQVLSEFDSILDEKWSGIISEPLFFKYLKK